MKPNIYKLLLISFLLASCAVGTPEATPTLTITPTLTSTPTSLPTSTPTAPAAGEIEMKQMNAELPNSFAEWPQYEISDFGDFGLVEGQVPTLEQRRAILNAIAKAATGAVRESQTEWDTTGITYPTGWGDWGLSSVRQNMMVPFLDGEIMEVDDIAKFPQLDKVWIMGVKGLFRTLWGDQYKANGITNEPIDDGAIIVRPLVMGDGQVVLVANFSDARSVDFAKYKQLGFNESAIPYDRACLANKGQKVKDGGGYGPANWVAMPTYNWAGNRSGGTMSAASIWFFGQDMDEVTKAVANDWQKEGKTSGVLSPELVKTIESTMWAPTCLGLPIQK